MAVHTKLSEANIRFILQNYRIGELSHFHGIKEGIENTNYLIVTDENKFIITIFEKRVDISLLPFYFEVMLNSKSQGIECPTPIKDKNGEYVNIIKNKKMAIFEFVQGNSKHSWKNDECFQLGEKLANFHIANIKNLKYAKNSFGISYWQKSFEKFKGQLDKIIPNSCKIINKELDFLSSNWPSNLPAGVIHADLFPDNVFFKKNEVSGFLDFYFSCHDFLSYDIAITINAWCFNKKMFNKSLFLSLVSGYESKRKLELEERKNINILLRGAALRFFFTRIHDAVNISNKRFLRKKNPKEFFDILEFHINTNSGNFYFE